MPRSVRSRVESIVQRIQNGAAQIKAHAAVWSLQLVANNSLRPTSAQRPHQSRVSSVLSFIQLGGGSHAEETPDKNAYLNALEECVAKLAALADNKGVCVRECIF